jgi:enoyl-CoA hydratase
MSTAAPAASTKDLLFARAGRVATFTINRPAEHNRLTPEALAALEATAHGLGRDEEISVVVIGGAGASHFSTGLLNPALRAQMTKREVVELVRLANRAFDAVEALPQIVIAALNGVARAGGAELALACDIRLAAAHATMTFPEAAWGGFPGAGAPSRLATLVGRGRALELIATCREIDAAEMERIGLAQGVHPAAALASATRALAEKIAAAGPLATSGAKRIIATRLGQGAPEASALSDALRYALEWSEDVDEGMAAHREGRAPKFKGR